MIENKKIACIYRPNFKVQGIAYTLLLKQYKAIKTAQKQPLNRNSYLMALYCINSGMVSCQISNTGAKMVLKTINQLKTYSKIPDKITDRKNNITPAENPKILNRCFPGFSIFKNSGAKISNFKNPGFSGFKKAPEKLQKSSMEKTGWKKFDQKSSLEKVKKSLEKIYKKRSKKVEGAFSLLKVFGKTESKSCLLKVFEKTESKSCLLKVFEKTEGRSRLAREKLEGASCLLRLFEKVEGKSCLLRKKCLTINFNHAIKN
jgi:hypothetical protein